MEDNQFQEQKNYVRKNRYKIDIYINNWYNYFDRIKK